MIGPTRTGWAVYLTDGRVVARFNGPAAKRRAFSYIARTTQIRTRRRPSGGR
jgi:hypothetical protein